MKYIIVLIISLFSPLSWAQTQSYFEESQSLTREIPSTSPVSLPMTSSKPLLLTEFTRYRLTVCPETGYSLTGMGTIRLYVFVRYIGGTTGKWGYRPELDQTITVSNAVDKCQTFGLEVDVRKGYLLPCTIGVGVTGGTTVTVRVDPDNF